MDDNREDSQPRLRSLEDQIVRYDYRRMRAEAEQEFDTTSTSKELVDQSSIAKMFGFKTKPNERN